MKQLLKEKQDNINRAWQEYRSYSATIDKDSAKWTEEQRTKIGKMDADMDALERDIERIKKDIEREARMIATDGDHRSGVDTGTQADVKIEERKNATFDKFLRRGITALSHEERAMMAGSDVEGGFLVTPQQFVTGILKQVDDATAIRQLATKHMLNKAASLGVVKLDDDIDDWEWTTELKTGTEDTGLGFGKRELRPHPIAKRIKISETLIRLANEPVQSLVMQRMAYKLAGTMESNYMTGNGAGKPLGLFVASTNGITTERDVSTDNTANAVTFNGLINAQGTLKSGYSGRWLFHRNAITKLRKIQDGTNNYIWQPGTVSSEPNMILGAPYILSEWCPNTWTTGQYVGMYADFSYYWILDALDMTVKVLDQLYAETNQIGYIGRYEGDAQPVMDEAFVRIKLG